MHIPLRPVVEYVAEPLGVGGESFVPIDAEMHPPPPARSDVFPRANLPNSRIPCDSLPAMRSGLPWLDIGRGELDEMCFEGLCCWGQDP